MHVDSMNLQIRSYPAIQPSILTPTNMEAFAAVTLCVAAAGAAAEDVDAGIEQPRSKVPRYT